MASTEKLIIFSAPSGSGKTTIVKRLLQVFPQFEFSISATSRQPRGEEKNGVDYFFLTQEEFREKVAADAFVEWEEVYNGTCYGCFCFLHCFISFLIIDFAKHLIKQQRNIMLRSIRHQHGCFLS